MADISAMQSKMISSVGGINSTPTKPEAKGPATGPSFKDALGQQLQTNPSAEAARALGAKALKFSNHAVDRMQARGINYSAEQMGRIEKAIDKAAGKGAKETLLLTDNSAMIVNIANRTVVTVMDKNALKENVFTNIDSTVVI